MIGNLSNWFGLKCKLDLCEEYQDPDTGDYHCLQRLKIKQKFLGACYTNKGEKLYFYRKVPL